jgi:hypothetical protein
VTPQANASHGVEFTELWRANNSGLATEVIHFEMDADYATLQTRLPDFLKQRINQGSSTTAAVLEPPLPRNKQ